ncbi:putative DNA-binding antitoxin AbrB/MazE fold protein [Caldanaerobacter subterraneus subsp. tengcongensis MB4]|uniref:S-layer homology domain protein n=1 Tax=Caldanaerobacter subterraneus subsp. tengcongensis (strain DSM 15242 / JCM 11007 / NBRC 100824 / MB4) TaxID=273068 RepID=Q8R724_CALS4|nr:S-layer homology domain-containing protein [Caldanaerobacter subterraneus]AAM25725.1 S-layer homology domain protein [Caldanaerobacter subterraneus subsp. tengcongensis MB4]MCS3917391.1 putative DNA-binding antitoxin AbrB/MazE fold protein [Caldanaerobacter subterraneus subsp. tengcongensis MB4]
MSIPVFPSLLGFELTKSRGNKISDEIARKVGFEMAFGIQEGVNYYGDNIMRLKRITVRDSDTGQDIVEKINKLSYGINFVPFWDIKGRQFEKDILSAIVKGIFAGYEDGSFKPEKPVTRAEFASLINKIFLKEKKVLEREVYFKDVPKNAWYYKAVVNVVDNEIMKGYEDNTFRPQKPVTWEEAVDVIKKFFDLNSLDKNMFKSPEKTLTREELAVLLDKII